MNSFLLTLIPGKLYKAVPPQGLFGTTEIKNFIHNDKERIGGIGLSTSIPQDEIFLFIETITCPATCVEYLCILYKDQTMYLPFSSDRICLSYMKELDNK